MRKEAARGPAQGPVATVARLASVGTGVVGCVGAGHDDEESAAEADSRSQALKEQMLEESVETAETVWSAKPRTIVLHAQESRLRGA